MSKCLLCKSNFKRQINYEIIFHLLNLKEKYACSDCLQKFVKKERHRMFRLQQRNK